MRIKRKDLVEALEVAKKFTATDFFGASNVWFDTENQKIVACDLTLSAEVELNMEDVYTAKPEATTDWPEEISTGKSGRIHGYPGGRHKD
jgi:hypothetical protein